MFQYSDNASKSKKRLGSRSYANYTPEQLQQCLQEIISGRMSQRIAAATFRIPRSTIKNKLKGQHSKNVGRSRVFSDAEELAFEQHLIKLADFGFPVIPIDFRMAVKAYLDKKGVRIPLFKENLPGYEWTRSYLKRHENLSVRMSSNIKRVRAQVGANEINNYMDNLSVAVKDIPPSRIWNYDETNLSDDPGNKKVICKRGAKYVEKICNFSKSATSVMFCGNAEGRCLAPYVVYKAEHLWTTWTENGPKQTRYNRSKSGWFDGATFEDWFEFHFLPEVKQEDGPVILIGDNLSSHISTTVLQLCEVNDIRFVCLPPNTTHISQPLDVAFFSPMKRIWRNILTRWKESKPGSKFSTIPKDLFPTLLKELIKSLEENKSQNLISGFRKCGIYPLNKQMLLDRLPENLTEVDKDMVGTAFLEQLDAKRVEYLGIHKPKQRRKKLQVPAGRSITASDLEATSDISGLSKATLPKPPRKQRRVSFSTSSDNSSDEVQLESDELSETFSDLEEVAQPVNQNFDQGSRINPKDMAIADFVLLIFNGTKYPGKIISISDEGPTVDCMEKGLKYWRWPEKKDAILYNWEEVIKKIDEPKMVSKRNQYRVAELDNFV